MADFTANFGVKTRCRFGGYDVGETPGSAITGTGNEDWLIDADGHIVPSGTYGAKKTFTKAAGETYSLLLNSGASIDLLLLAGAAHSQVRSTDTNSDYQLRAYISQTYATDGALEYGDTLYLRDGSRINRIGSSAGIPNYNAGRRGAIAVTTAGSGLTNGTYLDVEAIGGSGTGAKLNIIVVGNQVANVYPTYLGSGYQAGDVLTADAFPGASFTVIDMEAVLTIRSETPSTAHYIDERYFGGLAQITALEFTGGTRIPLTFEYIDFVYDNAGVESPGHIFGYRDRFPWGVGARYCYFANDDSVTNGFINQTAFRARGATVENCYFYRVQRGVTDVGGEVYHNYQTRVVNNVFQTMLVDGLTLSQPFPNFELTDNFFLDVYIANPNSHSDFLQYQGAKANTGNPGYGLAHQNWGTIARNICVIGTTPSPNNLAGQGSAGFLADAQGDTRYGGMISENNIGITLSGNAMVPTRFTSPIARRNTLLTAIDAPNYQGELGSTIRFQSGEDGLIEANFVNAISTNLQGGTVTVTNNKTVAMDASLYRIAFPNYAWGPFSTRAQVKVAATPAEGVSESVGGAALFDGRYIGALFPDGSWNDGSIYQATPATTLSASAATATTVVGQPVNVTIQSDSAVSSDVAVDVSISGVTGSASPDPATIVTGTSSKVTAVTLTSPGAATLSFTNNGGLSNPDPIVITATSPSTDPTSYTLAAGGGLYAGIGQTVPVTATLNTPATDPVTVTVSFAGASGAWLAGGSVVIPNGATSGTLYWAASGPGTVTFTPTNNYSLPNPDAVQVEVVGCKAGQLVAMGIR